MNFTKEQIAHIKNLAKPLIDDGENVEYTRGICELIADLDGVEDVPQEVRAEQIKQELLKTPEQKYMDNGGNECPHCGGTDISGCGFESDDTHAWREVECENCGKEWKELFSMTGIEL